MACPATLTINQESEDELPLDMAIYLSGIDKIIGCRGKWIYKFNATTGELESELRWATTLINESYICNIGSTVYVAGWRGIVENYRGATPWTRPWRNVYAVNASTMAVTGVIDVAVNDDAPYNPEFYQGFRNIVTDGTLLYGWNGAGVFWRMNPASPATYTTFDRGLVTDVPYLDMLIETTNNLIWTTQNSSSRAEVDAFRISSLTSECNSTPINGPTDPNPVGICFVPSTNKIYGVQGDSDLFKFNANEVAPPAMNNFTWSRLSILDGSATPVRVRYNSVDGLIYVPGWSNDKIDVVNPATDTVVATKTGFKDPIDCVFTPTKKWAVQNSGTALVEIT